jgi:uncharacterized protein (TIGR00730 family)
MKRICVFCGSSPGARPGYVRVARILGQTLASQNITLVYGGASVGLMGLLAKAALQAGGEVIGVITRQLVDMEVALTELPQLYVVDTMHERKARMADLSDGFIALPGGLGTIEEFFEILTWAQLGMHPKPCGLLNVCHYYDKLVDFLDSAVAEQFIELEHREMVIIDENPQLLLAKFATYQPPRTNKAEWVIRMTNDLESK